MNFGTAACPINFYAVLTGYDGRTARTGTEPPYPYAIVYKSCHGGYEIIRCYSPEEVDLYRPGFMS
jgi:hypothetical protein